uniref:PARP catalytic domain-containing protein n=1 Tax=Salarias fasciatus TaxID=181472 RepID=A0A672FFL8_SALFA
MFVALVLVGAYTKGSSSYVRPPPKGGSRDLYDSCVDSVSDPSIYVIFENSRFILNISSSTPKRKTRSPQFSCGQLVDELVTSIFSITQKQKLIQICKNAPFKTLEFFHRGY